MVTAVGTMEIHSSPAASVHTCHGLIPIVELISEVKAFLVIMMSKCPIGQQTFVVSDAEKSFAMNKDYEKLELAYLKNLMDT